MVTFERNEIISATQLVRQFSFLLTQLAEKTLNKDYGNRQSYS